ncbi:MAG: chromosome segregation protein SMC [Gammaproteobacteria bacterium]|nr:chromosome segregation protein SMC [Gammaproteobacteria bacterium]
MRLKKLQVSGFKSFVDTTDIRLPSHLVGVVGPNGCGKSNVIDAVRWVMGESSAKTLRGDSMADVIFNGSSSRKPVGRASVELVFDNSDGSVTGHYARFVEISVKRTMTRDGISTYLINHIKTRRRDVLDLFHGTGLGPRSYSIIEQGMVSRIVEARPEEIRVFVEEASGTSRYKARRRETENRIAHTRENLDRVSDIRDELDKQLRRLKRQSSAARRYKVLKDEERVVNGQLLVLRLKALNEQVVEQDRLAAQCENSLQAALAAQRKTEAELESLRQRQSESHDRNSEIQREFYQADTEITRLEQKIEYLKENRQRKHDEVKRLRAEKSEKKRQIRADTQRRRELNHALEQMLPGLEASRSASLESEGRLSSIESEYQQWLSEMERSNEQSRVPAQQVEVQKARMDHYRQNLKTVTRQMEKVTRHLGELQDQVASVDIEAMKNEVRDKDQDYEDAETDYQAIETALKDHSRELQEKRDEAAGIRASLHEVVSRLDSLQQIQEVALGSSRDLVESWMRENGLAGGKTLAENIRVDDGWQRAVDRVLNDFLGAVCVESAKGGALQNKPDASFSLITGARVSGGGDPLELPRMLDKVDSGGRDLSTLMRGVYALDSLEEALACQPQLQGRECIATKDGTLVGGNWVSYASRDQLETGILARDKEIRQLQQRRSDIAAQLEHLDREIPQIEEPRAEMESRLEAQRSALIFLRAQVTTLHNRFGREETRFHEARQKTRDLRNERETLSGQAVAVRGEIENSKALLEAAEEKSRRLARERERLLERRDVLDSDVAELRNAALEDRQKWHDRELEKQKLEAAGQSARENIKRLESDIDQSEQRLAELAEVEEGPDESLKGLEDALGALLEKRLEIEERLQASREKTTGFDHRISEVRTRGNEKGDAVQEARENLGQQKLAGQEIRIRRDTIVESLEEQGYDLEECRAGLPATAGIEQWEESLSGIQRSIARIGPVNLVAIEEYTEQSQRMEYLDMQHDDLSEALEMLENAIRKIDRESRSRFKKTFDKINASFNEFFPRLFGGGKAELLLTGDDLLTAGISVMAQPPGKRNSHIHLLSGGEKALTAVALLFSLFKLNPAPFCMLDEVDAPLDDANVDRYCDTLKTLAEVSQMIVITHNKITIESMDLLVGVTMAEAGVSRLVSVDIGQAIEMAAPR